MSASGRETAHIRPATVADAPAIGAVHLASWHAAYRDDAPPGWLAAQTLADRTLAWQERLADPRTTVLVAVPEGPAGAVSGFASLVPVSRDADAPPGTGEIPAFYVDPAAFRTGVGTALMEAALDRLAGAGCATVTLWVLETNRRAQAFYARMGFVADGARQQNGTGWPDEIRMARPSAR